jgi:hypothetical protein
VLRVATDGARNACSFLYGASVRVARALGFEKVITYTLLGESGASLRGAGFVAAADVQPEETWSRPSRPRPRQALMFDLPQREKAPRIRWEVVL